MIYKQIQALINKKHGKLITHANLFDDIFEIAKAARQEGFNKGILEIDGMTGISLKTIRTRLREGWSIERALTEPVNTHTGRKTPELIEDNPFRTLKFTVKK